MIFNKTFGQKSQKLRFLIRNYSAAFVPRQQHFSAATGINALYAVRPIRSRTFPSLSLVRDDYHLVHRLQHNDIVVLMQKVFFIKCSSITSTPENENKTALCISCIVNQYIAVS